jgi:outer membrane protein assembly factor BamB
VAACGFVPRGLPGQEASPVPSAQAPSGGTQSTIAADPVRSSAAPLAAEIASLVERLGASSFAQREAATQRLTQIGLPAKEALVAALRHSDAEVRLRARRCLNDILAADYARRIAAFADDADGRRGTSLPGWTRFQQIAGRSREARALFVAMHREEPGLMVAATLGSAAASEALATRCQQWQQIQSLPDPSLRREPSLAVVAAMIFLGSDPRAAISDNTLRQVFNFLNRNAFQQALQRKDVLARRLLGAWVEIPADATLVYQNVQLALRFECPEIIPAALRMAADRQAAGVMRMYAVLAVGRLGSLEHARALVPLLDDATLCTNRVVVRDNQRIAIPTQLRDIVLAVLLHLTGQDPKAYGYHALQPNPQTVFNLGTIYFDPEEQRDAALRQWQQWLARHGLPEPPLVAPPPRDADEDALGAVPGAPRGASAAPAAAGRGPAKDAGADGGAAGTPEVDAAPQAAVPPVKAVPVNLAPAQANPAQARPAQPNAAQAAPAQGARGQAAPAPPAAAPMPAPAVVQVQLQLQARLKQAGLADEQAPGAADEAALSFPLADRTVRLRLVAAQDRIAERRFAEAVQLLDAVLAEPRNAGFAPDRGSTLYRSLQHEALRLLAALPEEGLQAYQLQFASAAQQQLDAALVSGNRDDLEAVARRYFYTPAGHEAQFLRACQLLDEGEPLLAALRFDTLRGSPMAARYEPALSLRAAVAWSRAGAAPQAQESLQRLNARSGTADIEVAGRRVPLFLRPAQAAQWADSVLGTQLAALQSRQADSWLLPGGNAARNAPGTGDVPVLRPLWQHAVVEQPAAQQAIEQLRQAYAEHHLPAVPAGQPLVIGELVVFRTASELVAAELRDGRIAWRARMTDSVDALLESVPGLPRDNAAQLLAGLDERLWGDLTYGSLTSDGQRVFAVEDVGFAYGLLNQRMQVASDGTWRLDPGWPRDYNRLTAYDLAQEGKLLWELGGPTGRHALPLQGAFFLGPPLPLGHQLFVVAELQRRVELLVLDAATGAVRDRLPLMEVETRAAAANPFAVNGLLQRPRRRMAGASPSFDAGVLVCPLANGSVAAVDLVQRTLRWLYQAYDESPVNPFNPFVRFRRSAPDHHDPRWLDPYVTLHQDRVLLTPRDAQHVLCLDVRTGHVLWTAPREDGQFVAGVFDGVVVIVGRSRVRGLHVDDGRPAWPPLPLPSASAPVGRGYLASGRYVLPLASGELLAVDVATGRPAARVRSADGPPAGNLVSTGGYVVSQGVDRVAVFEQLSPALQRLAAQAESASANAEWLVEYGEALLSAGRHRDALAALRRAWQLRPDDGTRRLLCDAVLQALAADFDAYQSVAESLEPLFREPAEAARYQRALAEHWMRRGELRQVFAALLRMTELPSPGEELMAADALWHVRPDRWLSGQLLDVYAQADEALRQEIDHTVQQRLEAARQAGTPQAHSPVLRYFGWHPAAGPLRRDAWLQPGDSASLLQRELGLLQLASAAEPATRAAALVQLAQMLADAQRPHEAAAVYRQLIDELADVQYAPGRTVRQAVDALAADSPVRRALHGPGPYPPGRVVVQSTNQRAVYNRTFPLDWEEVLHPLLTGLSIEVDSSGQQLLCSDGWGRPLWNCPLQVPGQSTSGISPMLLRARQCGHLVLVSRGHQLLAIDTLHRGGTTVRVLWHAEVTRAFPGTPVQAGVIALPVQQPGRPMRQQPFDMHGRPLGNLGCVTPTLVCYQRLRTLVGADPLTGAELWQRHGVRLDSTVFGDAERVYVVEPEQELALVLRADDGRELGLRAVPPPETWVAVHGSLVAAWDASGERPALVLYDVWQQQERFRCELADTAKVWRITPTAVGALDAQGRCLVVELPAARPVVDLQLPPEPELTEVYMLPFGDTYLVMANRPSQSEAMVQPVMGGYQNPLVNGHLYAVDRRTAAVRWSVNVQDESLDLAQPPELPVLALASRRYFRDPKTNAFNRFTSSLVCIDKRTGRILHQQENAGTISRVELVAHPEQQSIEVRTTSGGIRLHFTGEDETHTMPE